MAGAPPFFNAAWCASSDFASEHHVAPPPGVSSSTLAPVPPPHTPSLAWSSAMAMTASGTSPGLVGMYPVPSPMQINQAQVIGSATRVVAPHPPVNASVSRQTFAQSSSLVAHSTSYGRSTTSFGIQTLGHGGDPCHGGQIMNYESVSDNAIGPLESLNVPGVQNSSSIPQTTVEPNLSHARNVAQLKKIDAKSLLVDLKGLITQANETAQKVASLLNIKLTMLPRKHLIPQTVASRAGLDIESIDHSTCANSTFEGAHRSDSSTTASKVFNDVLKSLKANESFYKDAPGVVQVPVFTDNESVENSMLPDFAKGERWAELTSQNVFEGDAPSRNTQTLGTLLPSWFWLFKKEVSLWKDLPSKYTSSLLQAAAGLTMVKRADLKKRLFTYTSSYGVAYSTSLANHIVHLLVFCLRAVYREATTAVESEKGLAECRVLPESAHWLSSQLSPLHDPAISKNLVFDLFKFALEAAAYCITFSHRGTSEDVQEGETSKVERVEAVGSNSEQKSQNHTCMPSESYSGKVTGSSHVGDGFLHLQHVAAAVLAIQSQGLLVKSKTCDSMAFHSSSSQRSAVHSMIVNRAEEVRATRADFRAVLEHDGLMWQRTQNQEFKKNKTKEEILAEERDYKRRRMSYRGKKVQRTPSEVLRDIIEGHMEEILAAGGIGNFGRIPQNVQLESDFSALGDSADATQTIRSSSGDVEGQTLGTNYSRYSRSEGRGSFRTDRGDRDRSISVSMSSSNQKNSLPYSSRYERSSHDHSADKRKERKYESDRKYSRWESKMEDRERSIYHHGGKQYSSSCFSRDRSKSPR